MTGRHDSAFEAMQDLRAQIDERLSVNEDYCTLRALDKAILEVKVVSQMVREHLATTQSKHGQPYAAAPSTAPPEPPMSLTRKISESFSGVAA